MPYSPPTHGAREPREQRNWRTYDAVRESASKRGYGSNWQHVRKAALIRDGYQCQACGMLLGRKSRDAHVDHIIPKREGGTNELSNLQTLCHGCHSRKTMRGG